MRDVLQFVIALLNLFGGGGVFVNLDSKSQQLSRIAKVVTLKTLFFLLISYLATFYLGEETKSTIVPI